MDYAMTAPTDDLRQYVEAVRAGDETSRPIDELAIEPGFEPIELRAEAAAAE
jgi:hypothetical protein